MGTGCLWVIVVWHVRKISPVSRFANNLFFQVVVGAVRQGSPLSFLVALSLFGWAIKQTINVIKETFVWVKLTFYNGILDPEIESLSSKSTEMGSVLLKCELHQLGSCPSNGNIYMKTAADVCVLYDIEKKQRP
ncbi:hypothetical protein CUMW_198440 [Citrus unshiu]|nr:hypothetical protein CUMW_198440 [Citrus unshiu]